MGKIAVITDSNSGITQKQAEQYGVVVVPMPFLIAGETYFEDVTLTHDAFFARLQEDVEISTSQPSPETVMEIWDKALETSEEVVYIPMSSGLSGSCQTAIMLADDYDGKVQVVNNQRISVTQKQSVLDALALVGQGWSAKQIKEKLEEEKLESSIYIMLDTLKYLKKGALIKRYQISIQRWTYHPGSGSIRNSTALKAGSSDTGREVRCLYGRKDQ